MRRWLCAFVLKWVFRERFVFRGPFLRGPLTARVLLSSVYNYAGITTRRVCISVHLGALIWFRVFCLLDAGLYLDTYIGN